MAMTLHSEVGRGGVAGAALSGAVPLSPEEVGQRIESARKEKRWSRLDLATAMDVSPSSIYRWEIGQFPSVHELMRLAGVLDKPVDSFTEPPERQVALADLQRLLVEALGEAERGRTALIASLSSLDLRLSRIEDALDIPAARDSEAQ